MFSFSPRDLKDRPKGATNSDNVIYSSKARKTATSLVALACGLLAILMLTHVGIQYTMRALLIQHAQSTGMDWAHHIEVRSPELSTIIASDSVSETRRASSAVEFAAMASGVLSVGNIYQIDVINPDCHCDVSLGSYAAKNSRSENATANVHDHGNGRLVQETPISSVKAPPQAIYEHAIGDNDSHGNFADSEDRFGLDRVLLQDIVIHKRNQILLHNSDSPDQPGRFAEVFHPVTKDGETSYVLRVLVDLDEQYARYAMTLYLGAGVIFFLVVGAFGYPTTKFLQTSRKQKEADRQAHFLANHDVMTNANNRNAFQNFAPKILQTCVKNNKNAAVYLFDVDNFKEVNDYHSHEAGDQVICALADMLKEVAPAGSYVARLGGDEFAVIVGGIERGEFDVEQILDFSTKLNVPIDDGRLFVRRTISGGVSYFPRDGSNLEELMRCADLALYAAKSDGGGKICEYDPELSVDFYERLDLRDEFKVALQNSEIVPFYQPLVNMNTGLVEGFEALARWRHPQRGILAPAEFHEMLEDHELSAIVGALMLKKTVQDMKRWKSKGVPFSCIGINVGEGDLLRPGFALNIVSELKQNGLRPKNLAVEITESCMFGSNKQAFISQLESLRMAGCAIALDDFGTGYSSITQIKELPCTTVKIDKSFVNDVVHDKSDQAIIQSLLELGETLGFKLVLEGVETEDQCELLRSLGCEIAQGYFYSKPIPADEVPDFLERMNAQRRLSNPMRTVA